MRRRAPICALSRASRKPCVRLSPLRRDPIVRLDSQTIAPGATGAANARLFAGAKEVETIDGYDKQYGLNRFELLIDWGWFYFITKPLFVAMDWLYRYFGNFGVAILLITVLIKFVFFPLANKSYASMARMKAV